MKETGIGSVHRRVEKIHQPSIQRDKHGTTVENSMEDSSHIILTSELVWDQMGLGTPTRADRGTLVKFHQPIWQHSCKCWEELRPVLRGLSTVLHSGRLGLAHGTETF